MMTTRKGRTSPSSPLPPKRKKDKDLPSNEEIALLTKQFNKLITAKKFGQRPFRRNHSINEEKKDQMICYGCQKCSHIKTDCPNLSKENSKGKDKGR
ncbi:hypothetical protein RHMOL_Rhmol03G0110700 [Rhododendron molle]|uniref:Uncharacterized protein n=1 Tax=Rhododendron molle TaxID=49168 RepID=A0ACC0PE17_RHOML|nr:hypothetical protein RHMOL_Rhmol03G0110700 [Rhododendron molle]